MNSLRTQDGFSLTEVVMAAMVFSIAAAGMFAVVNYLGQQQKADVGGTEEMMAALFGQEVLEELRICVERGMDDEDCLPDGVTYRRTSDDGKYTAEYAITDDGYGGRHVEMTVLWD